MGVQDFNKIPNEQLPAELFDLDILDGSPPCSSFSMAGSREKAWGDEKHFREGQAKQVLDDLFFHFIDTAEKLRPKVVVAENVKGLVIGKAKGYVKQIFQQFDKAGYDVQLFLLNAAFMGVPQKRERTFFIARRKDLSLKKIELRFNELPIDVNTAFSGITNTNDARALPPSVKSWSIKTMPGQPLSKVHPTGSFFNEVKLHPNQPAPTARGSGTAIHWVEERYLCALESIRLQTFPDDFKLGSQKAYYMCGMSVPPFMMQRVSNQIAHQWFGKEELLNG